MIGDGSSLYAIQGLWSAARYECGALFIVLSNGRYAMMDQLAARPAASRRGLPSATSTSRASPRSLGCPARQIATYLELLAALDEVLPSLAARSTPLLLDVTVANDERANRGRTDDTT